MNHSLFTTPQPLLLHSDAIVPHCFSREQGGKKAVFDQHMWQPYGKMQPARPHIAPQGSAKRPILGINQWRAGKASRHHACIAIPNSKANWALPSRPQAAVSHSCRSRSTWSSLLRIPAGGVTGRSDDEPEKKGYAHPQRLFEPHLNYSAVHDAQPSSSHVNLNNLIPITTLPPSPAGDRAGFPFIGVHPPVYSLPECLWDVQQNFRN
jgi:hypothetical protein